jgi:ribonuclease J
MGAKARQILLAAAPFMRLMSLSLAGPDLIDRQPIKIGPFCITPFLVDHSAYDAYALLIEADGKRLFYSGDFRGHGRKHGLVDELIAHPPSDIDTLLLEGTTMSRADENTASVSEHELEEEFVSRFLNTTGLVLIHASAQNIDRMVSVYRACQRTGRTLVIDLYTAMILEATGNPRIPQSHWERVALCVPKTQRIQIKRNGWFDKLDRHSRHRIFLKRHLAKAPDNYALLFRGLWMRDLEQADVLEGGCLIHSQWKATCVSNDFRKLKLGGSVTGFSIARFIPPGMPVPLTSSDLPQHYPPRLLFPYIQQLLKVLPRCFRTLFGMPMASGGRSDHGKEERELFAFSLGNPKDSEIQKTSSAVGKSRRTVRSGRLSSASSNLFQRIEGGRRVDGSLRGPSLSPLVPCRRCESFFHTGFRRATSCYSLNLL